MPHTFLLRHFILALNHNCWNAFYSDMNDKYLVFYGRDSQSITKATPIHKIKVPYGANVWQCKILTNGVTCDFDEQNFDELLGVS